MKNLMVTTALYVLLSSHSYASIVVLNGLTHVYSGNAGDRIEGELILMNTTDLPQQITFKLNDVIFSCETNRFYRYGLSQTIFSSLVPGKPDG